MIGKIIGAAVGHQAAKKSRALGGTTGAVLGAAVPFVLRRMSIPAMLALGAGGWFAKKKLDEKKAEETAQNVAGTTAGTPGTRPKTSTGTVIDNPPGGATNGTGTTGASTTTA